MGTLLPLLMLLAACSNTESTPGSGTSAPQQALVETTNTQVPSTATSTPFPATSTPLPPTATGTAMPPAATHTPLPPTPTPAPAAVVFDPAALQLELQPVVEGLSSPIFATHAGDGSGRLFVVEKAGRIQIVNQNGEAQPFLDISQRVRSSGSEQGLLGLAFHPEFAVNGRFFLYYTGQGGATVISRFDSNAERSLGNPDSEVILLTVDQPAANHNGGMIAFGPDGLLYAGLGDGGAANDRFGNGQNLGSLLGTLIRIDVDGETYTIPANNPFAGSDSALPEIWAYGLRNPWRFSFDRLTGNLYIADVGQNQWEEINFQPADSAGGENYGWPIMEATHCFQGDGCSQAGLVLPVAEYGHDQGCSVTGGYVYRGQEQPGLQGVYLYGDFCSGTIWGLGRGADGQWLNSPLLRSGLSISSFGDTEAGEVLVVDLNGGVYRVVATLRD